MLHGPPQLFCFHWQKQQYSFLIHTKTSPCNKHIKRYKILNISRLLCFPLHNLSPYVHILATFGQNGLLSMIPGPVFLPLLYLVSHLHSYLAKNILTRANLHFFTTIPGWTNFIFYYTHINHGCMCGTWLNITFLREEQAGTSRSSPTNSSYNIPDSQE